MSEISQGVRIIIERCKTNPDEMTEEYGKWGQLREAVYDYKENGARRAWLRGLTEEEISMLYEAFGSLHRKIFDDYVMKQIFEDDEEAKKHAEHQRMHAQAMRDLVASNPRVFAQAGGIKPGSWVNTTTQSSGTSITTTLKNALGIK